MSHPIDTSRSSAARATFQRATASETWDLILERAKTRPGSLAVFDVREYQAFCESHVEGAEHLDVAHAHECLARTPKSKTIVVYCRDGERSPDVAALFCARGFAEVYSVDGGFEALAKEHAERKDGASTPVPTPQTRYIVGDVVFARDVIRNDGGVPELAPDELIANAGTRGVVVQVGSAEADPRLTVYAVRFERADGDLGPMVGCLPEELSQPAGSR